MIGVSAGINQEVLVSNCQPDGQSVCMAVCGDTGVAKWPKIHEQTSLTITAANACKATIFENIARRLGAYRRIAECSEEAGNKCQGCGGRLGAKAQPCGFIKQESPQLGRNFQCAFVLREYEPSPIIGVSIPREISSGRDDCIKKAQHGA